jgi:dipeptidyl aminopeptidase/acylaminoacyl peptidase
MKRAILVVAAVALVTGSLYVGICAYAAMVLTSPSRNVNPSVSPATLGLAYQEVRFPSRTAGLELAGWYLPAPGSTGALVMVHGHTSSRSAEFGGRFVELMASLHGRGFAVLAIDLRGHGQSAAAPIGFGSLEHDDVAAAIDWLRGQGFSDRQLGVYGVSMGGAAAIRAAAEDPGVAALVTDAAPAAVIEEVRREWARASGLPDFFLPTTLAIGRLRYGIDMEASPALATMPRVAPRPALLIHGLADTRIPPASAERLAAAHAGAEVWLVPGAEHAQSYQADPAAYAARVGDFFARHVP